MLRILSIILICAGIFAQPASAAQRLPEGVVAKQVGGLDIARQAVRYPKLAQLPLTGAGLGAPSAPASYTGPGDIVASSPFWFGLRAYSHALANSGVTTTPVADVLGASTATSCTIYLKGDGTGDIDLTTAGAGAIGHQCLLGATTFCSVTNTSCAVSKLYDQSSSGCSMPIDVGDGFTAGPTLVLSFVGSHPALLIDTSGTMNLRASCSIGTFASPYTWANAVYPINTNSTGSVMIVNGGFGHALKNNVGNPNFAWYAGGAGEFDLNTTNGAWHSAAVVFNGASSQYDIDGTQGNMSNNIGTSALTGLQPIMGSQSGNGGFYWLEGGVFPGAANTTVQAQFVTNIKSYWGI